TAVAVVGEDVSAALYPFDLRVLLTVERRHRRPAEHKYGRFVLEFHDQAPSFGDFVGVAGAQDDETGNGAHRGQLLDGLVRRPVFTDADGVVREDVDGRDLHDRAEAYAGARIIRKDHEARTVGANLREREAVEYGRHLVLAYAEVEVAPQTILGGEIARAFKRQARLGRRGEVGR